MAILWGSTFVVLKGVVDRVPAPDLLAVRYSIALLALTLAAGRYWRMDAKTFRQGAIMGVFFGIGQLTQTIGLAHTHASISGFLTGTYVIFTPLLAATFVRTPIARKVWVAVVLALGGLGVLSIVPGDGAGFGWGEFITLVGAVSFAAHILVTGRFATHRNAMSLTLSQTAVAVVMCWAMAAPGGIVLPAGALDWAAVLYLALIAGAATLFLQSWAQAHVEPTRAAVVMCSEPVWAATFAVALGTEALSWQMVIGGSAIIAAMYVIVGRLPSRLPRRFITGTLTQKRSSVGSSTDGDSSPRETPQQAGARADLVIP